MKVQIFRLLEKNGFVLYEREKTKVKGCAPWPKYFINNPETKDYFKEFKTKKEATNEFLKLTA